ncbi:hypothetical protein WR25_04319 isoform B [Diploscapter pachys]|uniref:Nematode cuticle collagen N-terminal domain-containing protein n=1 Tax=Diploscapter pachys TaxID=2018661 RepID=A0A2A2JJC8_9BILA|nr:hypothetical protein WR25_04319 isoform B [Diploscapter pachys]
MPFPEMERGQTHRFSSGEAINGTGGRGDVTILAQQPSSLSTYQSRLVYKSLGVKADVLVTPYSRRRERMSAKVLVTVASGASGVVILACLVMVGVLFQDINNLYDEVMDEMIEFRMTANEAWKEMIVPQTPNLQTLFGRNKRQAPQCNCGPQSQNCPAGPPGPPGQKGEDGTPGEAGEDGIPGGKGIGITADSGPGGCISCPMGPPGPPGPDGAAGEPGPNGNNGQDGTPGQNGADGGIGEAGEAGADGAPGEPGQPGPNGQDAERGQGMPGPAGEAGPQGSAGSDGQPGQDGAPGKDGEAGPAGPDGQPGSAGSDVSSTDTKSYT